MTRPLSNDLRKRVIAALADGESCRSVAARFGVAVSSVVKWSQRHRATGSVAPARMGGRRKRALEPHRAFIVERINRTPHLASTPADAFRIEALPPTGSTGAAPRAEERRLGKLPSGYCFAGVSGVGVAGVAGA